MPLFPNPDFELNDNAGRTTEQIHAHRTGAPTTDDLQRWGATAARPLINKAGLPPSGRGIVGWTDLLGRALTGRQFHGIASAVLDHDDSAVARLHQFLVAAADWYDERGDKSTSRRYEGLADRFDALADEMVLLTEDRARAAYHRTAVPPPARLPTPPAACRPPHR